MAVFAPVLSPRYLFPLIGSTLALTVLAFSLSSRAALASDAATPATPSPSASITTAAKAPDSTATVHTEQRAVQVSQKDKLIWETHEIARITALQCHNPVPYNNYVNKWRKDIVSSEDRIMNDLKKRNIDNVEGFLTDEDNKIAKNLNEYYGRNICLMPDSITEETSDAPYDIEDIGNFDFNYGHLDVLTHA